MTIFQFRFFQNPSLFRSQMRHFRHLILFLTQLTELMIFYRTSTLFHWRQMTLENEFQRSALNYCSNKVDLQLQFSSIHLLIFSKQLDYTLHLQIMLLFFGKNPSNLTILIPRMHLRFCRTQLDYAIVNHRTKQLFSKTNR